jgi:hypothetical protein
MLVSLGWIALVSAGGVPVGTTDSGSGSSSSSNSSGGGGSGGSKAMSSSSSSSSGGGQTSHARIHLRLSLLELRVAFLGNSESGDSGGSNSSSGNKNSNNSNNSNVGSTAYRQVAAVTGILTNRSFADDSELKVPEHIRAAVREPLKPLGLVDVARSASVFSAQAALGL